MAADLIILDRNVFTIPASEIGETRVMSTYVDGRLVFQYNPGTAQQGLSSLSMGSQ